MAQENVVQFDFGNFIVSFDLENDEFPRVNGSPITLDGLQALLLTAEKHLDFGNQEDENDCCDCDEYCPDPQTDIDFNDEEEDDDDRFNF